MAHIRQDQTKLEKHLTAVIDGCLDSSQVGGRVAHGVKDVLNPLRWQMHMARAQKTPLLIAQLDLAKAFDTMHLTTILNILRRWRVDESFVKLLENIYGRLVRRNRLPQSRAGQAWQPARGAPQGDPLSPILSNVFMCLFVKLLRERLHGHSFGLHLYLDDITLVAADKHVMEACLEQSHNLLTELGLVLNTDKAYAAHFRVPDAQLKIKGIPLKELKVLELLGADMGFEQMDDLTQVKKKRWEETVRRTHRAALLPTSFRHRAMTLSSCIDGLLGYYPWGSALDDTQHMELTRLTCKALTGNHGTWQRETSMEIVQCGLSQGHRLFPRLRLAYQLAIACRRQCQLPPEPGGGHPPSLEVLRECEGSFFFELQVAWQFLQVDVSGTKLEDTRFGGSFDIVSG